MIYFEKHGVTVREAVLEDVAALKDRLRAKDAAEVYACGQSPEESLGTSFKASTLRYSIVRSGEVLAMFGIVPDTILGASAVVWLLGAPELAQIKKTFVVGTGRFLRAFLEFYPILWNCVDARYGETIRWLTAFGAEFEPAAPIVPGGQPFNRFILRRS